LKLAIFAKDCQTNGNFHSQPPESGNFVTSPKSPCPTAADQINKMERVKTIMSENIPPNNTPPEKPSSSRGYFNSEQLEDIALPLTRPLNL
jgi:hypothetical protein